MLYALIKKTPALFSLWYHLYRKNRGVAIPFFTNSTNLYLDGYPRSGNTYLTFLIKQLNNKVGGKLKMVHHFHATAPIKIAIKRKIPAFILFRDPDQAVTSYYLKNKVLKGDKIHVLVDTQQLHIHLIEYIRYYTFIAAQSEQNIHLIHFKELIKNPSIILSKISNIYQLNLKEGEVNRLILDNKDNFRGATDPFGSSLPTPEKEKYKKELLEILKIFPEYHKAQELYKSLLNKCLSIS